MSDSWEIAAFRFEMISPLLDDNLTEAQNGALSATAPGELFGGRVHQTKSRSAEARFFDG